jgi:hypothetical protein
LLCATSAEVKRVLLRLLSRLVVDDDLANRYPAVVAGVGALVVVVVVMLRYTGGGHRGSLPFGLEVPVCFGRRRGLVFVCLYDIIRYYADKDEANCGFYVV